MKGWLGSVACSVVIGCTCTTEAQGAFSGIEVVSESYAAWGDIRNDWPAGSYFYEDSYHYTDVNPVSGSVQDDYRTRGTSSATARYAFADIACMATQPGMAPSVNVYAEYRLTFVPQQPVLRLVWWGSAYGTADGGIAIGGLLSWWRCDDLGYGPPDYQLGDQPYPVIVEPGRTYTLTLRAGASGFYAPNTCAGASSLASLEAVPIPAPGAVVLGAIGVCLMSWLRRRGAL